MLKKSRLKSQTPLNFQAFFSKINGFFSKKPLFQRFSPPFKIFLAIIFLTTVAKTGITPIFAGWCSNEQFTCDATNISQPLFACNITGANAYRDPKYSQSGCSYDSVDHKRTVELHQICYTKCGRNIANTDDVYFSCCTEKNAQQICSESVDYQLIDANSTMCSDVGGQIIKSDSSGVCCNVGIKFNGDHKEAAQKCLALTNAKVFTYLSDGNGLSCDSGFTLLGGVWLGEGYYLCCGKYTSEMTYDEQCKNYGRTSQLGMNTKRYPPTYDSNNNPVCDPEDIIIYLTSTDGVKPCCQGSPLGTGDSSGGNSGDFSLNLNTNHLKLQSLLDMNPLQNSSVFSDPDSRTPGNIINQALTAVVFPIAGVGLIILILWGGFQVLSGSLSGKQNNIDLGKKRVTAAIVGFVLLFLIYWIWRLIALATGLSV